MRKSGFEILVVARTEDINEIVCMDISQSNDYGELVEIELANTADESMECAITEAFAVAWREGNHA